MSEEELKNMARLIDLTRQRLEQLQDQVSRLEMVQAEAADVETSLTEISRIVSEEKSTPSEKKQNKVMIKKKKIKIDTKKNVFLVFLIITFC